MPQVECFFFKFLVVHFKKNYKVFSVFSFNKTFQNCIFTKTGAPILSGVLFHSEANILFYRKYPTKVYSFNANNVSQWLQIFGPSEYNPSLSFYASRVRALHFSFFFFTIPFYKFYDL